MSEIDKLLEWADSSPDRPIDYQPHRISISLHQLVREIRELRADVLTSLRKSSNAAASLAIPSDD